MYLFIDTDGDVTQSDTAMGYDPECWPSVVKIEIVGMEMTAKQLTSNDGWKDVPQEG